MKAIVLKRYGPPQRSLSMAELPVPVPKENEVLVRIRATAINDWDWCFARGKPYLFRLIFGLFKPKLSVLGAEVSGVVEKVGAQVKTLAVGDAVYGDISEAGFGGFAEYACVSAAALIRKPPAMTYAEAAALPHAAMLALQGLVDVGQIQNQETVLINGAGGGVGILALQIAKRYSAEVTGVDRASKLPALRALGFDHVVDYQRENFRQSEKRYDLIFDTKTSYSPLSFLRALKPGGRYVTVGGKLPRLLQLAVFGPLISRITGKKFRIVSLKPNKDLAYINELFEEGGLKCAIDGPYPLHDVPSQVQRFGEGLHTGKIVIVVGE